MPPAAWPPSSTTSAPAVTSDGVVLYADLANPTSNAIYRRLGFVAVAEHAEWHLGA